MNLKTLNRNELDQRMKSLAQKERDLLHEVLLTIQEIDVRRIYLEMGFGSLFDYLVQGVGYSEGSAQRRIDAARLAREIPAVAGKIQSGELKLSQVSLIQKASREVFKTRDTKVTSNEKLKAIESLSGKNHADSQMQVAALFDLPVLQSTNQKVQADASVRVELTLSKEAFAKVKQAQELLSHAVTTHDLGQFLEYVAEKVIKQKAGVTEKSGVTEKAAAITATVAVKKNPSMTDVKKIRKAQGCCQYVDPETGRQCGSTWQLQVDHKKSRWAGGAHQIENLQLLCAGHNKLKYRKEVGITYHS